MRTERLRCLPDWCQLGCVALSPEEAASESFMRGFEIKSIEVMRGTDAIGRFGERAANGVVLLTTKD
jgi:hypothetical protein